MSLSTLAIRRIWLLAIGAFVDRDRPDLERLRTINKPDAFVWAILPHAARSFAPSILLLPDEASKEAAVGYLYARMLDTYEDISSTPSEARRALALFAQRFDTEPPGAAPSPPDPDMADLRDETHLLLIDRHRSVDEVFLGLRPAARARVVRLVADMAAGMSEFSEIFEQQGGVLQNDQQVLDYCHHVIGLPALFVMELLLGDVLVEHQDDALEVSELIQLANITRDVEKDLLRGVAYHPSLQPYLGSDGRSHGAVAVATARRSLMLLATRRAASFRRLVEGVDLPRFSPARAAAVMMMLFTDRHYRACAVMARMPSWSGPHRMLTMVLISLPAAFSKWWARRILARIERDLLAAAA